MVVDLDLLYIYLASVLTSASALASTSASEINILNCHNSLIFQARRLKFYMVVDLDLLSASGRKVRQKNARKTLCTNCCNENIFIFLITPQKF